MTEPDAAVGSGADEGSFGKAVDSHGHAGPAHDKTLADAAQLLRDVLEALPPERPQDAATARRLEGAVLILELQSKSTLNE